VREMQLRYNLLTIKPTGHNSFANSGKVFQAYIQDEISFGVGVEYQTIFEEVINLRNKLNQLGAAVGVALGEAGSYVGVGEMVEKAESWLAQPFAQGIAWTRLFGGVPEYIKFSLGVALVNFDNEEEVFRALDTLYNITVPKIEKHAGKVPQMDVMVDIGGWLIFKECFVTGIDHEFSKISVNGGPLSVNLKLSISTKYIVDRNLLGVQGKKIVVRELGAEGQR
jgi:hypothetical protein